MKNEHQWHEITTPPHFRFNCFKCGKACDTMRDTDARADLNGPAFKAYYCGACAQGANSVIRYVVTHVNKDGMRTLAHAQQGRNTYETAEQAQAWIEAAKRNNSPATLQSVYPDPDSLEVRPCECWPGHFDPKGIWFDLEEDKQ